MILYFLIIYAITNIVAAFVFWWDKEKSKKGAWRTSEIKLLSFAFIGPIGALTAMNCFHHKTRKLKFIILVPLSLALHLALIIMYLLN